MKKTSLILIVLIAFASSLFAEVKTIKAVEIGEEFKLEVGDICNVKVEGYGIIHIKRTGEKELLMKHPSKCPCIICKEINPNEKNLHPEIPFDPKEGHGLAIFLISNSEDDESRIVLRCVSPKKSLFKIVTIQSSIVA